MTTPNGHPDAHRVDFTGPAEAEYLSILGRAGQAGTGREVLEAMRDILSRLHRDPREFGEPMYHLRGYG
jgi:hypothetical protein